MVQLFRQYDKFDSNTYVVDYQNIYRKDFVNTSSYLLIELHLTVQRLQEDFLIPIRIPSDWSIFLLVLQSLMQYKYAGERVSIISFLVIIIPRFDSLKDEISRYYYRTRRFNLSIVKYLIMSTN